MCWGESLQQKRESPSALLVNFRLTTSLARKYHVFPTYFPSGSEDDEPIISHSTFLLLLVLLGFTTTDSINILLLRLQATQFSFIAQVLREDLVVALAWYFFQAVFPVKPRQKSALPDQRRLLFFLCDVELGRARNLTLFAVLLRSCSCVVTNTCFIPYYGRRC